MAPPLQLQFALGWAIAGLLNVAFEFLPGGEGQLRGADLVRAHAVDLGRHIGFGLISTLSVWLFQRWLPAPALLAWLAFTALSLTFGALFLPTDLDPLAERLSEVVGVSPEIGSGVVVLAVAGAVPALAWLTRQRAWKRRWLGLALQVASGLAALGAFACNMNVSPGNNPSAHLYLSWVTAILAGGALPRLELPIALAPARRASALALGAGLALTSSWALFGQHSNSVMIQLARCPSSLHLLAVLHGDGGLNNVHAAVAAQAGPFFEPRASLPPIPPSRSRPPVARPLVVLLSIDSLRADLLQRPEGARYLPNLSALAQTGASFKNARAPGSMTKYTLGAISSGKYFSQQYWSGRKNRYWPKEDQSVHLASVLSAAGVYTAVFPVTDWLMNEAGLLRGFEQNQLQGEHLPGADRWIDGRSLTAQLIAALEANAERPGFYWIHYLDSHNPYFRGGGGDPFQRYLRALRNVDEYVGQVREAITRLGLTERVLLFVTSDHGEGFGDHGSRFHGNSLYEELLRVPFVAVGKGVPTRAIDAPVSLIDLGPTILDWFGVSTPPSFMGESLVPLLLGGSRRFERPIVAETGLKQSITFDDGYKAIQDLRRDTLELYDLKTDPGELHNLSDQIDPEREEHVLLLRAFFQVHTYRENGYRVPYVK